MGELLWWHRVGQKVACVDDTPPSRYRGHVHLEKGAIYTIAEVLPDDDGFGVFLGFDELKIFIPCIGGWPAWQARRFRPIRETSIEQFRTLLSPTPAARRNIFEEMIDEVLDA